MKPLSERMNIMATRKRIRTPAIWTILKDYAKEVARLEADKEYITEQLHRVAEERDKERELRLGVVVE